MVETFDKTSIRIFHTYSLVSKFLIEFATGFFAFISNNRVDVERGGG